MTELMRWFADADRAVELEAERIRQLRTVKLVFFTLAMGFVMGCAFTYCAHDLLESWL